MLAATLAAPHVTAVAASEPESPPIWGAEFMSWGSVVTSTDAVKQAKEFDVISATKGMYSRYVGEMKAANPNLTLLVYLNGTFSMNDAGSAYPNTWYARDSRGNKIKSIQFGNYLMDPSNAGWVADVVHRCQEFLVFSGYDGCLLDTLGTAPLTPGYISGVPVNPATGNEWTKPQWLGATSNIAAQTTSAIAPRPVFGNGIGAGWKYFDASGPTSTILNGAEGGMVEMFVRPPFGAATRYRNEVQWKQDVDMLGNAAARGEHLVAITKVWSSASAAQKDSWHRYALSTFLLGYVAGMDEFSFRYDHKSTMPHPYWSTPIGTPTDSYAKVNGVYTRHFTGGTVLVNPTTAAVTVSLGGSYRTLQGDVVTSITLQPHTGDVLTFA
jgi:hypothetical protein